jgi:membrane-associated phospholipid phosphatase
MKAHLFAAPGIACLALLPGPALASDQGWDDAGTVGEIGLVAFSIGLPLARGDGSGALQAGGSVVAASLVTQGLKEAFPERRPDGSDNNSFPSHHTSVSFAAAASIQNRYGWEAGIPAQIVAAFVGYSRIEARKHHWYDVVAGAAIGETAGFLITSRHGSHVQVFPWGDTQSAGVTAAMRF